VVLLTAALSSPVHAGAPPPDVHCRLAAVSVSAVADSCLLSTQPFDNFGLLDRL
jgi:hypothetical protein